MERKRLFNTRLDENVIITMLAISIVAFIILAFKVKNSEPCVSFNIRASKVQAYVGDLIRFETNARSFKNLQWNFGDNKKGENGKALADHVYDKEDDYTVSLTVNDKCTEYLTISVSQPPPVKNPQLLAAFSAPQNIEVDKLVSFKDSTKGAYRWEWYFGETGTVDDTSQVPTYKYKTPGPKTVSVRINHDLNWFGSKSIFVNAAAQKTTANNGVVFPKRLHPGQIPNQPSYDPLDDQQHPKPEPLPVQLTGVEISGDDLAKELRGVADHQPSYTMEYFYRYTCNIPNIAVNLNGKTTTFDDVYNRLAKLPSTDKIKDLRVVNMFKDKNKCIQTLTINCYVKRAFLGKRPL